VYNNPAQAYQEVDKATMSGRETEARVLTIAALKLKECQNNWENDTKHEKLDAALRFNQQIWSIFQTELVKEDNPLPMNIKQDVLRLSAFVDRRIFDTMSFPSPEKLNIIIKINQNLAAGLRGAASGTI
jgi:flagellar protein FlaF